MPIRPACAGAPPHLFFPDSDAYDDNGCIPDTYARDRHGRALVACNGCPLRRPCLLAALAQGDVHTIRGGYRLYNSADHAAALAEAAKENKS